MKGQLQESVKAGHSGNSLQNLVHGGLEDGWGAGNPKGKPVILIESPVCINVPSPMVCKGNQSSNWEFFKQQRRDYEIATSLDKRDEKIRLATFRSIMGRDCVQILQNLGLTGENTLKAAEDALEAYFIPKNNIVYERLRLFDGTIVKPVGETTLMIERKGKHWPIKFQVVEVNNSPLISAETCKKLDLIKVNVEPVDYVKAEDLTTLTREFILDNYKDVFEGLGHIGDSSFVLNPDIKPVQHTPRRIPIALQDKVKDKLDDLETKGIIAKVSEPTEWISSMVVVTTPKKIRICLDPLDLNKAIQRPKYQMPTLEEVLPRITNAKVFSTLDAKDGFYQIKLDEQSSRKTTFWTPFGRYRYLRMPFGLNLAPEEFERKLHEHLDDLPGIIVLRDDILVVGNGETQEQAEQNHDQNLKRLLERARKVNLRLNSSKMCLRQPEVKFMGHIISKEGLKPDPDKVKAVENMPKPTTKEAKFMWAPQHDAAFNKIATDVPMKIEQKRRQTKFFYDKSAKILPQIENQNPDNE
ncbi:hypothetical protein QZH41_002413 [Actinostola sp. cb2023]|nr:hypothetical protein QZH41_002413 [Actinostola sp. cb2023]